MTQAIKRWDHIELAFEAETAGNPFLDVSLEVTFVHGHRRLVAQGFYDGVNHDGAMPGGGVWRARCMPDALGDWRWETRSNLPALDGRSGTFVCEPPAAGVRGPVQVVDRYHFAYADGTPYHPVGTTCYVWNHQGDALEEQTLRTLADAPFTKMRMCVFPKRYLYSLNEPPCYPFVGEVSGTYDPALVRQRNVPPPDYWDFDQFNPAYFRRLERRILDLQALGIEADLILFHPYDHGAWGFDQMPREVNERVLRYLVARLAAFRNVWWSFANEFDLMRHLTTADWDHYFRLVQTLDPHQHLRSIHNCMSFYDHAKPWVTHCSIQHHDLTQVPRWLALYGKPVVVDECGYEGDIGQVWGSLSAEELLVRMWLGFTEGGYVGHGETYWNPEERLWWSKGGTLQGESVARIGFLREVIEAVPAPGLDPTGADGTGNRLIVEGNWNKVAAGHRGDDYFLFYFGMHQPRVRTFSLPEGRYRAERLDTWNMTVEPAGRGLAGTVDIALPARKHMALRIIREG